MGMLGTSSRVYAFAEVRGEYCWLCGLRWELNNCVSFFSLEMTVFDRAALNLRWQRILPLFLGKIIFNYSLDREQLM